MMNKIDCDEILQEDINELQQIGPSIAEVKNFCELAKDVSNVSSSLTARMEHVLGQIEKSSDHFSRP